jgi:hypothetical protein
MRPDSKEAERHYKWAEANAVVNYRLDRMPSPTKNDFREAAKEVLLSVYAQHEITESLIKEHANRIEQRTKDPRFSTL